VEDMPVSETDRVMEELNHYLREHHRSATVPCSWNTG
jgi:hypothetical protein